MTDTEFPYERRLVKTNGVILHTVLAGDEGAPLVVLLHGFPEFWYGWRKQIDALTQAGFRVAVPDQRGYNQSDKPKGVENYRADWLAEDINSLIRALGYNTAYIVGHDWGGLVAWYMAIIPSLKRRVDKLVILNVAHPIVFQRTLRSNLRQLFRSWYAGFFQLPLLPETILSLNNYQFFLKLIQRDARPGSFTDHDLEQYRAAWSKPGAMRSMLNWYRAAVRHTPPTPDDIRVHMPTLMLWGAQDVAQLRQMAQDSIDLCDQGRLMMFEDATHWVQHDKADEVNRLIIEFLRH